MTLRPPEINRRNAPVLALDYEIAQERASALGRLGRALETALAALAEHDTAKPAADVRRKQLVQQASEALWPTRPSAGHSRLPRSGRSLCPDGSARTGLNLHRQMAA
jgi:hypothetical protein